MIEELRTALVEKMGLEREDIGINKITKNNGIEHTAFVVRVHPENAVAPVVYVDSLLDKIEDGGMSIDEAASGIVRMFENGKGNVPHAVALGRDMILEKCVLQAIGADKNAERLKNIPHRIVEDIAVIAQVEAFWNEDARGVATINYDLMENFGLTENELFDAAKKNTIENSDFSLKPMCQILAELTGTEVEEPDNGLYVVTNKARMNGAVAVAFPDLMAAFARSIGQSVYVLPSSIHEVLLVPKKEYTGRLTELKDMVTSINRTQVAPEEVLTDSVYEFDLFEKKLKIAV